MKRRSFVQASLATICAATAGESLAAEGKGPTQFYELRAYSLKAAKQSLLDDYLSKAFIPALKRYGIGPVGVFVEKVDADMLKVLVLIVHSSAAQFAVLSNRLANDDEHRFIACLTRLRAYLQPANSELEGIGRAAVKAASTSAA